MEHHDRQRPQTDFLSRVKESSWWNIKKRRQRKKLKGLGERKIRSSLLILYSKEGVL